MSNSNVSGLDLYIVVTYEDGSYAKHATVIISRYLKDEIDTVTDDTGRVIIQDYLSSNGLDIAFDYVIKVSDDDKKTETQFTTSGMTEKGIVTVYITLE